MTHDHKQKLEEEKARLVAELNKIGKLDPETGEWEATPEAYDQSEADYTNAADRNEDFEEKSSLMTELEARYIEVETALSKMHDDEYGLCDICGKKIEEERLTANPAAQTCVEHMGGDSSIGKL